MGTSTPYGGPQGRDPLIPSWLGGNEKDEPLNEPPSQGNTPKIPNKDIPKSQDPERLKKPRANATRYINSGGSDSKALGRAVSGYVGSSGSSTNAMQKMGASRGAAARIGNFISSGANSGFEKALKDINCEHLIGRPLDEVFSGLSEYICPDGGNVDEGLAREAFIETIISLSEEGFESLDDLTEGNLSIVVELYVAHSIQLRICNDIANKLISLPDTVHQVEMIQQQMFDFIRSGVSDAITSAKKSIGMFSSDEIKAFTDDIYEQSFAILQQLGDGLSGGEK